MIGLIYLCVVALLAWVLTYFTRAKTLSSPKQIEAFIMNEKTWSNIKAFDPKFANDGSYRGCKVVISDLILDNEVFVKYRAASQYIELSIGLYIPEPFKESPAIKTINLDQAFD